MNSNGPIIDVDSHVADTNAEVWRPHLARHDLHLAPEIVKDANGVERLLIANRLFPRPDGPGCGSPLGIGVATAQVSVRERIEYAAEVGIEHAILQPGFVGLAAMTTVDTDTRRKLLQAHNRLAAEMDLASKHLHAAIAVSMADEEWSIEEIEQWSPKIDLVAVVTRPTSVVARPFAHADKSPLMTYLIANDILLILHTATGYYQVSPMADVFDEYVYTHALSHPFEQMAAIVDLIRSGALSRGLKLIALEGGCGWLPWLLDRLAAHFAHTGGCEPVSIDPHELIQRQLALGIEPDDPGIGDVIGRLGTESLTFSSDFPHWDAASPSSIGHLAEKYGSQNAGKILYSNANRLLGHRF